MSNKHDANVRKSTLVNFQIGLIASLLFTYVMFEVYTAVPVITADSLVTLEEPPTEWNEQFKVYEEPKPKEVAVKHAKPVVAPEQFKVIDNDTDITDADKVFKNEPIESTPIDPGSIIDADPGDGDEPKTFPFIAVEDVPVFPGCEKLATNKEKAACFSEKVGKIISRKFNTGLGEKYGLTGVQRIYTQFDVDTDGMIKNIQVRATHPKLKKEAQRVINLFPQMTPGKQRGRAVTVKYQLPIVFKIQN